MPARPETGDAFKPEDLFPIVDETVTVKRVGQTVRVPAGRFTNAIEVQETSRLGMRPRRSGTRPASAP